MTTNKTTNTKQTMTPFRKQQQQTEQTEQLTSTGKQSARLRRGFQVKKAFGNTKRNLECMCTQIIVKVLRKKQEHTIRTPTELVLCSDWEYAVKEFQMKLLKVYLQAMNINEMAWEKYIVNSMSMVGTMTNQMKKQSSQIELEQFRPATPKNLPELNTVIQDFLKLSPGAHESSVVELKLELNKAKTTLEERRKSKCEIVAYTLVEE